jgi:uncharacterized protein YndB with AHSA1/START domain
MAFQQNPSIILAAPPQKVYTMLATDEGRARFWAESAIETSRGVISWRFPNGLSGRSKIIEQRPPLRYVVEYWEGSIVTFELAEDEAGGTDLTLTDAGVPEKYRGEITAGWVSVLMTLKAAVDFSIDLRNHDPRRTWDADFADN